MKSTEEVLNEIFNENIPSDFDGKVWDDKIIEAMKAYALEAIKHDRERVAEHAYMKYHCGHFKTDTPTQYHQNGADNIQIDKESILNLPIELK